MLSLELPSQPTDYLKLADWLEILAIISDDGNSSSGDLANALSFSSVLENDDLNSGRRNAVEEKCLQAFAELEARQADSAEAYPFIINSPKVTLKPDADKYAAYIFCLCLSYFQWSSDRHREMNVDPWLLFEELSAFSAKNYLSGDVMRFGTSRGTTKKAMSGFRETINTLCSKVGEGVGFKEQDTVDAMDDRVDLVAWKHFEDKKTSKIVMFGQCAGGANWLSKLGDLNPEAFWGQWMKDGGRISPFLRSFYIPHRIEIEKWDHRARYTGLLFDRCRIAYWAFQDNGKITSDSRFRKWYKYVLKAPNSSVAAVRAKKARATKPKRRKASKGGTTARRRNENY